MECRASLFVASPEEGVNRTTPYPAPAQRNGVSARYSSISASSAFGTPRRHHHSNRPASTPPVPKTQKAEQKMPLPLPKNLVMLELMDEHARKEKERVSGDEEVTTAIPPTCGTYEVRDRDGVQLCPENPKDTKLAKKYGVIKRMLRRSKKKKANSAFDYSEDSTSLPAPKGCIASFLDPAPKGCIASFLDPTSSINESLDATTSSVGSQISPESGQGRRDRLDYGQKVQVVHIAEGVAKLPRGKGYIVADSTQLVKVGKPEDKMCQMEGEISHIAREREKLSRRLRQWDEKESKLRRDMETALLGRSGHPVIENAEVTQTNKSRQSASSFASLSPIQVMKANTKMLPSPQSSPLIISERNEPSWGNSVAILKHSFLGSPGEMPRLPSLTDKGIAIEKSCRSGSFDSDSSGVDTGCVGMNLVLGRVETHQSERYSNFSCANKASHYSSNQVSPRAISDWVDFRTGMSGHRALSKSRSFGELSQPARGEVRMMGEHKGISHIKTERGRSIDSNSSSILSMIW